MLYHEHKRALCPREKGTFLRHLRSWGGACPPCPPVPTPLVRSVLYVEFIYNNTYTHTYTERDSATRCEFYILSWFLHFSDIETTKGIPSEKKAGKEDGIPLSLGRVFCLLRNACYHRHLVTTSNN